MKLWIAQGFGIGRIPFAPGTFGSVIGVAFFALLAWSGSWLIFSLGMVAGFFLSVWLCGEGEKILNQKDPGSVVLDEITAIPLCFVASMVIAIHRTGVWPGPQYFCGHWIQTIGVFILFRLFDISKPWPVYQSQSLPGGWGITVDDFLAALYVNAVVAVWLGLAGK